MTREQYETGLQKRGFEIVGSGCFATVLAKGNLAVKVARHDGWPNYIRWATERGYAGIYAPKVYSLKFHADHAPFYVAFMERLVCTLGELRSYSNNTYQSLLYRDLARTLYDGTNDHPVPDGLRSFANELRAERFADDIHDGNIMVRSDGQIVITDPSVRSGEPFRLKRGAFL